ncbi:glutathione S-transferase [Tepidamorphus gemmatus]|uniref:Glutathione S-transferase n=1 Tax=Tepidamorphus gemmatus TaxID=747076 RepID=A0A4R3ML26_9HYPH|nr:glutathione S-transferase [Tepidamorphus gemmatus]TCT13478.1 glutathione S-transferase [Tepidamorphus gemmatus]
MKLYTCSRAPNPRRVNIFMAEKGIDIPRIELDIMALEHKTPEFAAINPIQRLPVLELDDGTHISESVAICRFLDELHPEPPLFGTTALERALVDMWQRRLDLNFLAAIAHAFRHVHPAMAPLEQPQIREWGEANRPKVLEFLGLMDREVAEREFVAGDRFTIADISMLVAVDFMKVARLAVPTDCAHVRRWHGTVSARPSAAA